jgi:hypothetical protein
MDRIVHSRSALLLLLPIDRAAPDSESRCQDSVRAQDRVAILSDSRCSAVDRLSHCATTGTDQSERTSRPETFNVRSSDPIEHLARSDNRHTQRGLPRPSIFGIVTHDPRERRCGTQAFGIVSSRR